MAAKNCGLGSETIIYSSDFSSAMQTAQIIADAIGAANPIASTELGERNFGELEFESDKKYANVWHVDSTGREYGHGVENLVNVANIFIIIRLYYWFHTVIIFKLYRQYTKRCILL